MPFDSKIKFDVEDKKKGAVLANRKLNLKIAVAKLRQSIRTTSSGEIGRDRFEFSTSSPKMVVRIISRRYHDCRLFLQRILHDSMNLKIV